MDMIKFCDERKTVLETADPELLEERDYVWSRDVSDLSETVDCLREKVIFCFFLEGVD
jgi:hypothetical protein